MTARAAPGLCFDARWPTLLGLAFFASLSFPSLVDLPGGVTLGQLLMLAGLPVWFVAAMSRNGRIFDDAAGLSAVAVALCCALLIVWSFVSAFGVDDPFRAARPIVALTTGIALLCLVTGTVTRERLIAYVGALCFALALTSVAAIVAFAEPALKSIIFLKADRAFGFFKNPNQFGIAISTLMPVAVAMTFAAPGRRLIWAACVASLFLGLVLTGSKANLLITSLTTPLCLVLFAYISQTGPRRFAAVAGTLLACAVLGALALQVLYLLNPRALRLLDQFVVEGEATHSLVSRSVLWADSAAVFLARPVFGMGPGTSIDGLPHSHNVLLDYARTLGAPGLVLMSVKLAVILGSSAAMVLRSARAKSADLGARYLCIGLALGPVAYIASNFSSDSLGPTTSPFLYSVLFLGLAARSLLAFEDGIEARSETPASDPSPNGLP